MSRSARLFRLLDALRRVAGPVTAARLADETGVSVRTLYRDIEALRSAGARIDGAAGLGYTLTEDPALPPQHLARLEVEALVLGLSAIRDYADPALIRAGENALAKIIARMPDDSQRDAMHSVLRSFAPVHQAPPTVDIGALRHACWDERAVDLNYADAKGNLTQRRVWPLCLVYTDNALLLVAHCLLRDASRSFRLDRIRDMTLTSESFRPRRVGLLRRYSAERQASRVPRQ